MTYYKNVSPLGALEIPALGISVDPDEVFEVPGDLDEFFAAQSENFKRDSKPKVANQSGDQAPTDQSGEDAPSDPSTDSRPAEGDPEGK